MKAALVQRSSSVPSVTATVGIEKPTGDVPLWVEEIDTYAFGNVNVMRGTGLTSRCGLKTSMLSRASWSALVSSGTSLVCHRTIVAFTCGLHVLVRVTIVATPSVSTSSV